MTLGFYIAHTLVSATDDSGTLATVGGFKIYAYPTGTAIRVWLGGTQIDSTTDITLGVPIFVEVSVHNDSDIKIYIDGSEEASTTSATPAAHNGTALRFFAIGANMFDS